MSDVFRGGSDHAERIREAAKALAVRPLSGEVNAQIDEAMKAIAAEADGLEDSRQAALFEAAVTLLAASKVSMQSVGECELATPYADIYMRFTPQGRVYCCTHPEPHCYK